MSTSKILVIISLIGFFLTIAPGALNQVSFASPYTNETIGKVNLTYQDMNFTNPKANNTYPDTNTDISGEMDSLAVNATIPASNTNIGEIGPGVLRSNATNSNTNIADIGVDRSRGVTGVGPVGPVGPVGGPTGGVIDPMEPLKPAPNVVHLRIMIPAVRVFDDHDGPYRGDGEWHLMGMVNGKPFTQVGQPVGEIDTPDNEMNDVTGEYRGNWGTAEQVNFNLIQVDVDVNNTNPLEELRFDFYGIEQDGSGGIPGIPSSIASINDKTQLAAAVLEAVKTLYSIKDKDYLGSFQKIFNRDDNWWVGTHIIRSDMIYSNYYYPDRSCEFPNQDCPYVDWPNFSDWAMAVQVIDRDGPRCADGWTYQYRTNICTQNQVN